MPKTWKKKSREEITKEIDTLMKGADPYMRTDTLTADARAEYLQFMSKMYRYSNRNQALIRSQYEGAGFVASFNHWKQEGHSVRKGQKGIKILKPSTARYYKDTDGKEKPLSSLSKEDQKQVIARGLPISEHRYYTTVAVFDVTQTDMPAEDYPKYYPNRPFAFEATNPEGMKGAIESLKDQAKGLGIQVYSQSDDLKPNGEQLGAAKGVTYYNKQNMPVAIQMSSRLDQPEYAATLVHELAHAKLHGEIGKSESKFWSSHKVDHETARAVEELQAEMTSYVVSESLGIDTKEEAMPYIASWTKGMNVVDAEPVELQSAIMNDIQKASREIIETVQTDITPQKQEVETETKAEDKAQTRTAATEVQQQEQTMTQPNPQQESSEKKAMTKEVADKLSNQEKIYLKYLQGEKVSAVESQAFLSFDARLPQNQRIKWRTEMIEKVAPYVDKSELNKFREESTKAPGKLLTRELNSLMQNIKNDVGTVETTGQLSEGESLAESK